MIELCTFTGVDARTDLNELADMAGEHPRSEFGVLLSLSPGDKDDRYPDRDRIELIADRLQGSASLALHVCGSAVRAFVEGDQHVTDLASRFGRVQLNFACRGGEFPYGGNEALSAAINAWHDPVITQHNEANAGVALLDTGVHHHILFDASGGRGIAAERWPEPFAIRHCGYAGGIGPETIETDLEAIHAATLGNHCWIDMESKVRTDGFLDLGKCRTVLEAFARYRALNDRALVTALANEIPEVLRKQGRVDHGKARTQG